MRKKKSCPEGGHGGRLEFPVSIDQFSPSGFFVSINVIIQDAGFVYDAFLPASYWTLLIFSLHVDPPPIFSLLLLDWLSHQIPPPLLSCCAVCLRACVKSGLHF